MVAYPLSIDAQNGQMDDVFGQKIWIRQDFIELNFGKMTVPQR
jgi:hypothetical protein